MGIPVGLGGARVCHRRPRVRRAGTDRRLRLGRLRRHRRRQPHRRNDRRDQHRQRALPTRPDRLRIHCTPALPADVRQRRQVPRRQRTPGLGAPSSATSKGLNVVCCRTRHQADHQDVAHDWLDVARRRTA